MATKTRTPLSRDRVLRKAIAIADKRGVGELTMRKLAKELGIEAMSLYNHVANKTDLLDGMIDLVFAEIEPPSAGGDLKVDLRRRVVHNHGGVERHRMANGGKGGWTNQSGRRLCRGK